MEPWMAWTPKVEAWRTSTIFLSVGYRIASLGDEQDPGPHQRYEYPRHFIQHYTRSLSPLCCIRRDISWIFYFWFFYDSSFPGHLILKFFSNSPPSYCGTLLFTSFNVAKTQTLLFWARDYSDHICIRYYSIDVNHIGDEVVATTAASISLQKM